MGQNSHILLRAATSWPPVVLILRTQQMLKLIFSTLKPLLLLFNSFWLTNIEFKIRWCWLPISIWLTLSENCPLKSELMGERWQRERRMEEGQGDSTIMPFTGGINCRGCGIWIFRSLNSLRNLIENPNPALGRICWFKATHYKLWMMEIALQRK